MHTVGVVIPCKDRHDLLIDTTASILAQKDIPRLLGIIVDDGSDPPLSTIPEILDGPWQVLRNDLPEGVQKARNLGWGKLRDKVDYIMFSDSDIVWEPHAFKKLVQALVDSPKAAYSYCSYKREGKVFGIFRSHPFDSGALLDCNYISTMSMIRANCLFYRPFVTDEARLQDWSLWLRFLMAGYPGVFVDEYLFTAFFGEDSISMNGLLDYEYWYRKIRQRYVIGKAV